MRPPAPDATLDYWPILRQSEGDLSAEIAAGTHDAYLPQLERMELGHDGRRPVLDACCARRAALHETEVPSSRDDAGAPNPDAAGEE